MDDLLKLNAKKILLSHISHKVSKTQEEIERDVKEIDKRFEVAYDGMIVEF